MNSQNAPFGMQPCLYSKGTAWNGGFTQYPIASGYAVSLFQGDPVAYNEVAHGTIKLAVAGAGMIGVFQGCFYMDASGMPQYKNYWPQNTAIMTGTTAYAYVVDDYDVLFNMQASTSSNATPPAAPYGIALTDLNKNANFAITANAHPFPNSYANNPGAGNPMNGLSGFYLDMATVATTPTLSLRIRKLVQDPRNGYYSTTGVTAHVNPFNNVLVSINNDSLKGGTGTDGV